APGRAADLPRGADGPAAGWVVRPVGDGPGPAAAGRREGPAAALPVVAVGADVRGLPAVLAADRWRGDQLAGDSLPVGPGAGRRLAAGGLGAGGPAAPHRDRGDDRRLSGPGGRADPGDAPHRGGLSSCGLVAGTGLGPEPDAAAPGRSDVPAARLARA